MHEGKTIDELTAAVFATAERIQLRSKALREELGTMYRDSVDMKHLVVALVNKLHPDESASAPPTMLTPNKRTRSIA